MTTIEEALHTVERYIQASMTPAKDGRKCVDGRYLPDQSAGMISRPGGDCGYVMALLALNSKKKLGLTPEQCFNAVYKAVASQNGFCMHTDHHADPNPQVHVGLIGCGHLAKAANKKLCKQYHINNKDVTRFIEYARNLGEISRSVHMVNLVGEHQEKGVLIVDSLNYSVLADNPALQEMYFIYDAKRDDAFLKYLVKEMGLPGVTFDAMKHESDHQLQITLQQLALGLPIFHVQFRQGKPIITSLGVVKHSSSSRLRQYLHKVPSHFLPRLHRFIARS